MERIIGSETEFALAPIDPLQGKGRGLEWWQVQGLDQAVRGLLKLAHDRLPHVDDRGASGLFLANGARLYVDTGAHIEYAVPETSGPADAVCHILAGEAVLQRLTEQYNDSLGGARTRGNGEGGTAARQARRARPSVAFFKTNVDYSGARTTFGCHENYGHRTDNLALLPDLLPHLCSRVIYTGAGGFDPFSPLRFTRSPRVHHLATVSCNGTTSERPIFNTRDERLAAAPYRRLHLICGESQCSHLGMFLKLGTTALLVAMAEGGARPGRDIVLADPVSAIHSFATGPLESARVPVRGGAELRALEIQRRLLERAEQSAGEDFMPQWAPQLIRHWREALEWLESGSDRVARTLDWAIKQVVFAEHCRARGFSWDRLGCYDVLLRQLDAAARDKEKRLLTSDPESVAAMVGSGGPLALQAEELRPDFDAAELTVDQLPDLLALRAELFEIDMRYAQLGAESLFAMLDSQGLLEHRVPGLDDERIGRAVDDPPADTRAGLRGRHIRELVEEGRSNDCHADWFAIWDKPRSRTLDLGDPFCREPKWVDTPPTRERSSRGNMAEALRRILETQL